VNYYKNILTAFTLISVNVAAILILRNLKGIFGHFPVKGHIQGWWIQNLEVSFKEAIDQYINYFQIISMADSHVHWLESLSSWKIV
jgi:hypothetical protein